MGITTCKNKKLKTEHAFVIPPKIKKVPRTTEVVGESIINGKAFPIRVLLDTGSSQSIALKHCVAKSTYSRKSSLVSWSTLGVNIILRKLARSNLNYLNSF